MKTMPLIEKKRSVRACLLSAVEAETDAEFRVADMSRRIVPLSSHVSTRKARRILVPVDFTESSDKALDCALLLADRLRASIVLVHVVERIYAEGFLDTPAKRNVRTEAHRRAREELDAVAESKSDHLVPIRHVVRHGVPKYEILLLAESMDVDLIILGRPPRNPLSRLVFGSVSRALVDTAPCPVVVVPAGGRDRGFALFLEDEHQISEKQQ
jgi:nucleotide-binding universal stress UspA family protein